MTISDLRCRCGWNASQWHCSSKLWLRNTKGIAHASPEGPSQGWPSSPLFHSQCIVAAGTRHIYPLTTSVNANANKVSKIFCYTHSTADLISPEGLCIGLDVSLNTPVQRCICWCPANKSLISDVPTIQVMCLGSGLFLIFVETLQLDAYFCILDLSAFPNCFLVFLFWLGAYSPSDEIADSYDAVNLIFAFQIAQVQILAASVKLAGYVSSAS